MKKKKILGVIIIFVVGLAIQYASYYGGYLEKHYSGYSKSESWNLVFKENFQNIPRALGSHLPIIFATIIAVSKYKKQKNMVIGKEEKISKYDEDELKELDRKNKKLLIVLGIMISVILLLVLIAVLVPNNDSDPKQSKSKSSGNHYCLQEDGSIILCDE